MGCSGGTTRAWTAVGEPTFPRGDGQKERAQEPPWSGDELPCVRRGTGPTQEKKNLTRTIGQRPWEKREGVLEKKKKGRPPLSFGTHKTGYKNGEIQPIYNQKKGLARKGQTCPGRGGLTFVPKKNTGNTGLPEKKRWGRKEEVGAALGRAAPRLKGKEPARKSAVACGQTARVKSGNKT